MDKPIFWVTEKRTLGSFFEVYRCLVALYSSMVIMLSLAFMAGNAKA